MFVGKCFTNNVFIGGGNCGVSVCIRNSYQQHGGPTTYTVIPLICAGYSNVTITKPVNVNLPTVRKVIKCQQESGVALDCHMNSRRQTRRSQAKIKAVRGETRRNPRIFCRKLTIESSLTATKTRKLIHGELTIPAFRLEYSSSCLTSKCKYDLIKTRFCSTCWRDSFNSLNEHVQQSPDIGKIVFRKEKLFTVGVYFNKTQNELPTNIAALAQTLTKWQLRQYKCDGLSCCFEILDMFVNFCSTRL